VPRVLGSSLCAPVIGRKIAKACRYSIAAAAQPAQMAAAFKLGVEAGRRARLAGRAPELRVADASSPLTGFLAARDETR